MRYKIMSSESVPYLLVGCDPDEACVSESTLEELKCSDRYKTHGSYYTGEEYFIGLVVDMFDLSQSYWPEKFKSLKLQASKDLGCDISCISIELGVLEK